MGGKKRTGTGTAARGLMIKKCQVTGDLKEPKGLNASPLSSFELETSFQLQNVQGDLLI